MDELRELWTWSRSLETGITFLLLLPFFVAIAGFLAERRALRANRDVRAQLRSVASRSTDHSFDSRPHAPRVTGNVPRP